MKRKLKRAQKEELESIMRDCLKTVKIGELKAGRSEWLFRLLMSGIAKYFFEQPDNFVDVGFIRFKKNPEKEELFAVEIIKDEKAGVTNAETLWRYYTGELSSEKELKSIVNNFVNELLKYSQEQEEEITNITGKLM
jgi:hypothetical protein